MEIKERVNKIILSLKNVSTEISGITDEVLKENIDTKKLEMIILSIIEKLEKSNISVESSNVQLSTLIDEITNNFYIQVISYETNYYSDLLEKYNFIQNIINSLLTDLNRIDYLSLIREKNVVLVGGNGAGKSSFASFLKDSMSNNIVVIPAQKFLFYNRQINSLHLTDKEKMRNIQQTNFIGKGKFTTIIQDYEVREFMNDLSELFSRLVTVISNEQVQEVNKIFDEGELSESNRDNTILFKINKLWQSLIPDIVFELDTTNRILNPKKNNQIYSINSLSDGEKAILYYVCQIFLAEPNSFIVVDEPETFLNVSNFSRLWDTLESYRQDCKFIYISHVIDFIVSRSNVDMLWCKQFTYPDSWNIERVEYEGDLVNEFPKGLLSEILGARIPILFCEGDKNSHDYFVYSNLFREEVVVCPVGGHTKVIEYTRAYNNSPVLDNNCAYGIIDSDLMSEDQILKYKSDNVYTLPFNEIEMIFFTRETISNVLEPNFSDVEQRINNFVTKFFEKVNQEKEEIVGQITKKYLDNIISNYRVNKIQSGDEMINEIKDWLTDLKIATKEKDIITNIEDTILNKNYEELLKISPQKKAISIELANRELDSRYLEKAKVRLSRNRELVETIKQKYFSEFFIRSIDSKTN
ncbi:DUF4435 domain-containing protein [Enterococcus innesii]|uniref:DUF4435 domain-containing protein n=1 Tax=Enterococcus innesii TaxID=2839759 RepID=UPI003D11C85D